MNLKHLWTIVLLCLAVTLNAQAQISVKGTVTDETGAPMIGVAVILDGGAIPFP